MKVISELFQSERGSMKGAGRKEDQEFGPGEFGFRGTCVQNRSPIPRPH